MCACLCVCACVPECALECIARARDCVRVLVFAL